MAIEAALLVKVVALVIPVILTVMAAYGKIIYSNDDRIEENRASHDKLHGRLYGEDRGMSGDINNIKESVDRVEEKQDELCERTELNAQTLNRIEATTHFIVDRLVEEDVNGDLDAVSHYYESIEDHDDGRRSD